MPLLHAARDFVLGCKDRGFWRFWAALPRGWRIVVLAVAAWLLVALLLLIGLSLVGIVA